MREDIDRRHMRLANKVTRFDVLGPECAIMAPRKILVCGQGDSRALLIEDEETRSGRDDQVELEDEGVWIYEWILDFSWDLDHSENTVNVILAVITVTKGRHAIWNRKVLAVVFQSGSEPKFEGCGLYGRCRWTTGTREASGELFTSLSGLLSS